MILYDTRWDGMRQDDVQPTQKGCACSKSSSAGATADVSRHFSPVSYRTHLVIAIVFFTLLYTSTCALSIQWLCAIFETPMILIPIFVKVSKGFTSFMIISLFLRLPTPPP